MTVLSSGKSPKTEASEANKSCENEVKTWLSKKVAHGVSKQ